MLKVKNIEATSEVLEFLKTLKIKQRELETQKQVYYPVISLYLALKHKIFYKNLLLHPLILQKRYYHDDRSLELTIPELVDKLSEVLSFEFTEAETYLTDLERNKLIKVHKKLKSSLEKLNAT